MASLFPRRILAWLLAITVIAGAGGAMAASLDATTPIATSSGESQPAVPAPQPLDDSLAAIEDDSRRLADAAAGGDMPSLAASLSLPQSFAARPSVAFDDVARHTAAAFPRHKTGPPAA